MMPERDIGEVYVVPLTNTEALDNWGSLSGLVDDAMERSPRLEDTTHTVLHQLKENQVRLARVGARGVGEGLVVMELMHTKKGLYLNVWGLAGEGMDYWLDSLVDWLERYAGELGTRGLILGGRVGWTKRLARYGFKTDCVIMRRELEICH